MFRHSVTCASRWPAARPSRSSGSSPSATRLACLNFVTPTEPRERERELQVLPRTGSDARWTLPAKPTCIAQSFRPFSLAAASSPAPLPGDWQAPSASRELGSSPQYHTPRVVTSSDAAKLSWILRVWADVVWLSIQKSRTVFEDAPLQGQWVPDAQASTKRLRLAILDSQLTPSIRVRIVDGVA